MEQDSGKEARIDAIVMAALVKAMRIEQEIRERIKEIVDSVAARSGTDVSAAVALSAELLLAHLEAMAIMNRLNDPKISSYMFGRLFDIHGRVSTALLRRTCKSEEEAEHELKSLLAAMDVQVKEFLKLNSLAEETIEAVNRIIDGDEED